MPHAGSPREWIQAEFEEARVRGQRVLARGAGRRMGAAPEDMRVLPMQDLRGILEHHPDDLTVEVGAGTRLSALNTELAGRGQWFPLGLADGDDDTLGGIVSMGLTGLMSGYGAVRDRVLGLHAVTPAFGEVRLGSGVVKSVAGYNMPRLYWGSRGAFGILTALTLKLAPRPPTPLVTVATRVAADAWDTWWPEVERLLDAGWPDAHAEVLLDGADRTLHLTAPADVLEASPFATSPSINDAAAPGGPAVRAEIPLGRRRVAHLIGSGPDPGVQALASLGSGVVHILDSGAGSHGALAALGGPGGRVFGGPPAPVPVPRDLYPALQRFHTAVDPDGILLPLVEGDP